MDKSNRDQSFYFRLMNALKEIEKNKDVIQSLKKLLPEEYFWFDPDKDCAEERCETHNIDKRLNIKDDELRCICGKQHIRNIYVYSHKDKEENIIIGKHCMTSLINYTGDGAVKLPEDVVKKILKCLEKAHAMSLMSKKKQCKRCGEKKISKTTKYKNKWKKHFCKDCIWTDGITRILCWNGCNEFIPIKTQKIGGITGIDKYCSNCRKEKYGLPQDFM